MLIDMVDHKTKQKIKFDRSQKIFQFFLSKFLKLFSRTTFKDEFFSFKMSNIQLRNLNTNRDQKFILIISNLEQMCSL